MIMGNNELIKYEGGLIKRVGNAISVTSKLLALSELQLIPYRKGDKWGFCTPNKKIVIDCVYEWAYPFVDEMAIINLKEKWKFVDKKGNEISPSNYDSISNFLESMATVNKPESNKAYCYSENLAPIIVNGKYGFIDLDGKEVIACKYDFTYPFAEGLGKVKIKEKWGYISKNGIEYWED